MEVFFSLHMPNFLSNPKLGIYMQRTTVVSISQLYFHTSSLTASYAKRTLTTPATKHQVNPLFTFKSQLKSSRLPQSLSWTIVMSPLGQQTAFI